MRVSLGSHSFDTTTRALVMGVACEDEHAIRLVDHGADLIEVIGPRAGATVSRMAPGCRVPLACAPDGDRVPAGASLVSLPASDLARRTLDAVAEAKASANLVAARTASLRDVCEQLSSCARAAEAAGVASDRIVVSAGPHRSVDLLRATSQIASLGYPVVLDLEPWPEEEMLGAAAFAVARGARVLRTRHVTAARRIADTVAAVLEAS